ncbi:MAG: Na/Pi symporter, partial [Ekhidna sp.]
MIGEIFLSSDVEKNNYQSILSRTLVIGVSILLFLLSIELMGLSIAKMAEGWTNSISRVTENPFVGLFIGLLSTALLQSSSTTTSIAVAAVASSAISLENAIPIVIGANIGT